MHDEKVSRTAVVAYALWALGVATWVAGAITFFAGVDRGICVLLCFAACLIAVGAATATVRSYFTRLFGAIRTLYGIEHDPEVAPRPRRTH